MKKRAPKILVCITSQLNSRRLITFAHSLSENEQGEFHILHVKRGNNILDNEESLELLQELFSFGSELGGVINALCADDVLSTIISFVKREKITTMVLGEPSADKIEQSEELIEKLREKLPLVEIAVLARE